MIPAPLTAGFSITGASWAAGEIATQASGNDLFGLLIAVVSTCGGVLAAYVATRGRRRQRDVDEITISRDEYDRLREMEHRRGNRHH